MKAKIRNGLPICLLTALCLGCSVSAVCVSTVRASAAENVVLSVDTMGFGRSELPNGYAGKTYPVFAFTATDGNGRQVADAQATVFDPSGNVLPVKNGRFDTEAEGEYTIEYLARKGSDVATDSLQINVLSASAYSAPTYTVNEDIVDVADTGNVIFLPEGTLNGENVTLNVSVEYDGLYACDPQIEERAETAYFTPEAEGDYIITYTLTDFVGGRVEAEKVITVFDSDVPVLRVPSVSKVAHVGEESKYPIAEAVLYRDGAKIYVPVKTSVGNTDITESMTYTPTEAGTYTVKYTAANVYDKEKVSVSEQVVTVYGEDEADSMYAARYFAFNNMQMGYRTESDGKENFVATLSAVAAGESSGFHFKTPLRQEYLSVLLGADGADSAFGAVQICFTDSKYSDERISIVLRENAEKRIDVFVNGNKVTEWNKTFTGEAEEYSQSSFTVGYDAVKRSLVDENGETIISLSAYENGKVFRGFTSGSAYLSVEMQDVTEESAMKLYRIAGQTISDAPADTLDPLLIYRDGFMRIQNADIGETVTIGNIEAFDLFSPAPTLTATVTSPSGKKVYNGDIRSNVSFTAEEYGVYYVEYAARDSAGRERSIRAVVQVIDRIAPEIKIGKYLGDVKQGEEYTLSAAEFTDNYSETITGWISVSYENSAEEFVQNGKYTFKKAGVYTVTYGATDAAGNRTLVSYTVNCK